MLKPLIFIRKRLMLPIKWAKDRRARAKKIKMPKGEIILQKIDEATEKLREGERLNHERLKIEWKARLEILEWVRDFSEE